MKRIIHIIFLWMVFAFVFHFPLRNSSFFLSPPSVFRSTVNQKEFMPISSVREAIQYLEVYAYTHAYWKEKGVPKEIHFISVNGYMIGIFNWNQTQLSEEQKQFLLETLHLLAFIGGDRIYKNLKFILIDDQDRVNPATNEKVNGYADIDGQALLLYPPVLSEEPHRIKAVSNFSGTMIHELTHFLLSQEQILKKWIAACDWRGIIHQRTGKILAYEYWGFNRLVSYYAYRNPEEDFCESMVAYLKDSKRLKEKSKKRFDFMQQKYGLMLEKPKTNPTIVFHYTYVRPEDQTFTTEREFSIKALVQKVGSFFFWSAKKKQITLLNQAA